VDKLGGIDESLSGRKEYVGFVIRDLEEASLPSCQITLLYIMDAWDEGIADSVFRPRRGRAQR
jgi:hypothetical protein